MFARTRIAGGVYTDSAPVAAADWVRVRESNGYFYYDYSADGTNWTQFASCGHPWTPDLLDYSIPLVWLQSASGVPPAGYVDHVNYVPPVVGGGGAMSYLGKYDAGFNATTSPRTVSVTAAAGDLLVALSMDEEDAEVFATPTGGAVTWTQQQQLGTASRCRAGLWSAPVAAGATWTYSQAVTGSVGGTWGTAVARFANGVPGASALTTGSGSTPPALALSTTAANSGILVIMADWSGVAGTSRVWNAVNGYTPSAGNGGEIVYTNSSGNYTAYAAWYPDAGPVGAKNLGFTTNFAGGHTIAAIEVKKSVGSPFDLRLAGIF
jgi:hypothetical protein